jgi:hypothetical protein
VTMSIDEHHRYCCCYCYCYCCCYCGLQTSFDGSWVGESLPIDSSSGQHSTNVVDYASHPRSGAAGLLLWISLSVPRTGRQNVEGSERLSVEEVCSGPRDVASGWRERGCMCYGTKRF